MWWAQQDSNLRPADYESVALPLRHGPALRGIIPDLRSSKACVVMPVAAGGGTLLATGRASGQIQSGSGFRGNLAGYEYRDAEPQAVTQRNGSRHSYVSPDIGVGGTQQSLHASNLQVRHRQQQRDRRAWDADGPQLQLLFREWPLWKEPHARKKPGCAASTRGNMHG